MAVFYKEGERKTRPGIYQRHTNTGFDSLAGAQDGICAIPVRSTWGPLGKVIKNTLVNQLWSNYGSGTYGEGFTVPAAAAMFGGGASTVYTYRLGSGGKQASKVITEGLTVTAKYPGTMPISVAVQQKIGDAELKQFLVYAGTTQVEVFEFSADGKAEGANLIAAAAKSAYVTVSGAAKTVAALAAASGALEGGEDPTVTNGDYSQAFAAFEPYYYNTIALDKDDDENMTLSLLLQEYLKSAYELGKLGIIVVGEKTSVAFENRLAHAKAFNDAKVVYLGGGYLAGNESRDGVMAICHLAGVIAATPSNRGIVHTVIDGATDVCESLTYAQYEEAIRAGMLMVSLSPDGEIWYDSGINTLVKPEGGTQDDGWKKIRRTKTRFEMIDRLDRELMPKVGRVSADSDGVADVVQTGQRVLNAMVSEGKLFTGAKFVEDPANPFEGDSAWFIIQADDIDSLEKIYLQYQFRYSQNV
nr:MAG TPA: tail sheath protein [Caudoviricetes sp.]